MGIAKRALIAVCVLTCAPMMSGCADELVTQCAGVGLSRVLPSDTTVAPGTNFLAIYQDGGYCVGQPITDADYSTKKVTGWFSLAPSVATVDALTGVVTAIAPGDARIANPFAGYVTVHVR
jgi:hypothetical protein